MAKFFYIKDFVFSSDKITVEKNVGYYTDASHSLFCPSHEISRKLAIQMIKNGDVLFVHDGYYRQIIIKIVCVEGEEFVRVDSHFARQDYYG